jgi:hypothetical protein
MATPDFQHAADFLATIGHGLHLSSIVPDGSYRGRWFGEDVVAATDWAKSENEHEKNVYWTVNLAAEGCRRGKPGKADIVAARFIHVDIDPPKGSSTFDKLAVLAELCALSTPPSLIIDSGGGLQAFWRLAGGAAGAEVEAVNQAVAARLGGDNCHNIDRLMRLPGTLNYPNSKKRASGRTVSLAKVIYDADGLLA